jgi:hypothetical protein
LKALGYPRDKCKRCFEVSEPRILIARYAHQVASFRANELGEFRPIARTIELSWQTLAEALKRSGRRYTLVHQNQDVTRILFRPTPGMDRVSVVQGGAVDTNRRRH